MQVSSLGVYAAESISGAALYVDTENLRDAENARQIVASVVADWPGNRLPLGSLSLYVRADKAELWRLWVEDAFPGLCLRVRGVQHFSANNSKNSADMAIAADAVSDLVTGRANDVAVVSNDSDFAALFVKVRELAHEAGAETVPFLWIHPPDGGALSPEIDEFIPAAFRWDLAATLMAPTAPAPAPVVSQPAPKPLPPANRRALPAGSTNDNVTNEAMAEELIRRLPPGRFRAADAQEIVSKRWPKHPASGDTAKFGQFLGKEIWPILQKRGVTMPRKSSPRTYEISQAAKDPHGRPTAAQASAGPGDLPANCSRAYRGRVGSLNRRRHHRRYFQSIGGPDSLENRSAPASGRILHGGPIRCLVRQAALAGDGTARRHHRQGKAPPLRDDARRPPPAHQPGLAVSKSPLPGWERVRVRVVPFADQDDCKGLYFRSW